MSGQRVLRAGTRRSRLAMRQTEMVVDALRAIDPDLTIETVPIVTTGDRILDAPLAGIGDRGVFVREIELALLNGEIDFAVHSLKDLPGEQPPGLCIAAVPAREDPHDVLLAKVADIQALRPGARVGTSSLRRTAQLRALRPDLAIENIRGNIDTRLAKLESGEFDAIVLAAAGLKRLGLTNVTAQQLPIDVMLPAVSQGAIGIEAREGDEETRRWLDRLSDVPTFLAVRAERAFLRALQGGCQVPLAGHAVVDGEQLRIQGLVASLDGTQIVRGQMAGSVADPEATGRALAESLLERGAGEILAALRGGVA